MNENRAYWSRRSSRLTRRDVLRGAVYTMVGGAGAVLLGCGGNAANNGNSAKAPTRQASVASTSGPGGSPQAAAIKPVYGGKLQYAVTLGAASLDPHIGTSGSDFISWPMYDNLIMLNNGVIDYTRSLAEKNEFADPQTLIFHTRNGVTFHDGTAFDANTVAFNVQRLKDPATKATAAAFLVNVDHVETPDASTSRWILKQPDAGLLFGMSGYRAAMVPQSLTKIGADKFLANPVGSGPFIFKDWVQDSHLTYTKNAKYWGKDAAGNQRPYLDEITVQIVPDGTVRFANLRAGQVNAVQTEPKDIATAKSDGNLVVLPSTLFSDTTFDINIEKAPLNNDNLRKAMAWAMDSAPVNQAVYFGLGRVPDAGPIPPGSPFYQPLPGRPKLDLTKAKQYLSAGGQPDGFSVTYIVYADPLLLQAAQIWQGQLAQIGIKATIEQREVSAATAAYFTTADFPAYYTSFSLGYDPAPWGASKYLAGGFYNPNKHSLSPQADMIIAKATQTYDTNERKALYTQLMEILVGLPRDLPMMYTTAFTTAQKKVGNTTTFYDNLGSARFDALWMTP